MFLDVFLHAGNEYFLHPLQVSLELVFFDGPSLLALDPLSLNDEALVLAEQLKDFFRFAVYETESEVRAFVRFALKLQRPSRR